MSGVLARRRAGLLLAWAMLPLPFVGLVLPPFWLTTGAVAVWSVLRARSTPPEPPRWLLNLAALGIGTAVLVAGGWRVGPLRPLGHLLLLLAAVRVATVRDRSSFFRALRVIGVVWVTSVAASHHWALLGYLAASVAGGWWLGMHLLLEELGVPAERARPSWRHATAAAAASLVLAAPVFVTMPRLRSPIAAAFGSAGFVSGFGTTVDAAGVGSVRRSRRLAVRVTGTPKLPEGNHWMYLRGAATLWLRTGTWKAPARGVRPLPLEYGRYWTSRVRTLRDTVRVRIELFAPRRYLPLPEGTVAVEAPLLLAADRFGGIRLASRWRGPLTVTAWVAATPIPYPPARPEDRTVARPDARVGRLTAEVARGAADARTAAARLTGWLRRNCTYTLSPRIPLTRDPLTVFLFETRRGHCELYASSLAAMLRYLRHPARVVVGYAGGTLDPERTTLLVREENAHAWVEVWDAGSDRWLRVDPSPPTRIAGLASTGRPARWRWVLDQIELFWDRHLLGFNLAEQIALAEAARRAVSAGAAHPVPVVLTAVLAAGAAALWRARRRHPHRPPEPAAALLALARRLECSGVPVPPGATLRRIARLAREVWPDLAAPLAAAVPLAELRLYGSRALTHAERKRALTLARQLRTPGRGRSAGIMAGRRSMRRFGPLLLMLTVAVPLQAAEVAVLRLDDTIQPASQRYLERGLHEAAARGAALAVVELDTPGGLLPSAREMTTAITTCPVPVAVYVAPSGAQAASAGFFLLQAADVAAMAPGTNTGAAHPVGGQGENLPEDVREKATQDAAALVRSLAERRGRDPELAAKAVTESLSFTAQEALRKGLIDVVARDRQELYRKLHGRTVHRFNGGKVALDLEPVTEREIPPTSAERLLSVLANPNVAYLLMALAMIGLYTELSHPGLVLPGVVGVVALLLGLYSLSVLPVNLAGVALIAFALVLFLLEVKVTSYGLLTIGGLVSFVLGSLMLFDSPIPDLRVSLAVILPTAVTVAAVVIFLLSRVIQAHRRKPLTGIEGLLGEVGEARSALDPRGKVFVHGEWWDAESEAGPIPAGAAVRVTAVEGRTLRVAPVENGRS